MDHKIFIQACKFLQSLGSPYEALISPFWSDVQDGVVLPTLGKVIPRMAPERSILSWDEAMADAAAAGLTLPSREELQYMYHHLDQINGLLLAHNGNRLPRDKFFWARTKLSRNYTWYIGFGSGTTDYCKNFNTLYCRPLAEFKKR